MFIINNSIELVIAKYEESINWVKKINPNIKSTIYDKSDNPIVGSISLQNIGRETNTYFTHIINNYENLNDWVVFCQGDPMFHISYFIDLVNNFPNVDYKPTLTIGECFFYNTCFGGRLVLSDNYGRPHDFRGINVLNTWKKLFQADQPGELYFSPGCQFIISKKQIHKRSKEFFERCLEITIKNEFSPWEFERIMHYVMDPNFK